MLHLLLCSLVFLACAESQQADFYASLPGTSLTKYNQFISTLTTGPAAGATGPRYVHSSGGAAGGVISEGQGYGIFAAATTAAILGPSNSAYNQVLLDAYNLFLGWQHMSMLSTSDGCQNPRYCTSGSSTYPCLPHWKFADDLSSALGTGSAPDGDEDAILGMIIMLRLTQNSKPSWWTAVAKWAYQSCQQFYTSETVAGSMAGTRIIKLGACWGGWDCQNPSYHSPFAYKAMRDFMSQFGSQLGFTDGATYVNNWNQVINTSYAILSTVQCHSTGLIPNWYVPNSNPTVLGTTSCSGSGTPGDQFGSEACRSPWRVAIDYVWTREPKAKAYLGVMGGMVAGKFSSGADLSTGCLVNSILTGWLSESFMYGPTLGTLINPNSAISNQQTIVNNAGTKINAGAVSDYYSGSWTVLSLMLINGDLSRITSIVTGTSTPVTPVSVPVAAPKPVPVPVAAPKPVPAPVAAPKPVPAPVAAPKPVPAPVAAPKTVPVAGGCANVNYGGDPTNDWYIVIAGAPTTATVSISCASNVKSSCTLNPTWGRFTCNPTASCAQPRSAIVNGVSCALNPATVIARLEEDSTPSPIPSWGIALIVVGAVGCICLIIGSIFYFTRPVQEERV